jgi:hypothetical protein
MCNDMELPVRLEKEIYKRKFECNYNPFIAKWAGEDDYKPLNECGITILNNKLNIDYNVYNKILSQLYD